MGTNILVIPDSHAAPNESLERFRWLGKFIVDRRPDIIVDIGDRADLPSLSTYDKGTKGFEGRRYTDDLEAVHEANRLMLEPLKKLQRKQRRNKKKVYNPHKVITLGNHEHRILRAANSSPELSGFLSYDDLRYHEDWEVHDFLDIVTIEGVSFSHYFVSGVMSRPIGGVNAARSQILKTHTSCVSGHSHLLDYAEDTDASGSKIQSLVCGCYVEDNPAWNTDQAFDKWSSGIVMLNDVKDGTYDLEQISIERIERTYG